MGCYLITLDFRHTIKNIIYKTFEVKKSYKNRYDLEILPTFMGIV